MIEFQLDTASGVATYLQLVQQVHQALQLGLLEPGDQLPTAQQVVAKLAINPNTVLKAYRDLEREGLVRAAARPRYLRHSDSPALRPVNIGEVPRPRWPSGSSGALGWPWSRRHRGNLQNCVPELLRRGRGMTSVLETDGLGKRYGRKWALQDCTLAIPAGKVVGLVGPNGAGKTTLLNLAVGLLSPSSGTITVLGGHPGDGPEQLGRGRLRRPGHAYVPVLSVAKHLRMGAYLNANWDRNLPPGESHSSASTWVRRRARFPVASGRNWRSPWRSQSNPSCFSSTSR